LSSRYENFVTFGSRKSPGLANTAAPGLAAAGVCGLAAAAGFAAAVLLVGLATAAAAAAAAAAAGAAGDVAAVARKRCVSICTSVLVKQALSWCSRGCRSCGTHMRAYEALSY
jgi:hypothetical protein